MGSSFPEPPKVPPRSQLDGLYTASEGKAKRQQLNGDHETATHRWELVPVEALSPNGAPLYRLRFEAKDDE